MSSGLLRQTLLYSAGEIIPKLIGFILLPVYTAYLSPTDYGIIGYTSSFTMVLYVLSALSLNSFVIRNYFELKTEVERQKMIGNIFVFIGILNLLILILAYLVLPIFISHFSIKIPWNPYFKLALIINFLDVFSIIPLVMYRVKQQANYFVLLSLTRVLFQLGLTFYFVVIRKDGLIGNYLGQLFPLLIYFIVYWVVMIKRVNINIDLRQIRVALKFSLPLLPGTLAYLALSFADRVILERYVDVSLIGIYNVAYMLSLSLNIVIQSGYKAIEPEIFKRYDRPDFAEFIRNIKSLFLFVVYCGAMFISLYAQEIFKLMASPKFYEGYRLVPIIMVGIIMTGQNVIFGGILTAEKSTKVIGLSTIVGATVNILFNLLFVKSLGVYAAALSVAISFATMNYLLYYRMRFKQKTIKDEILAILLFIFVISILFYIVDVDFSLPMVCVKFFIFIAFAFLTALIFKLKLRSYKMLIK